MRQKNSPKQSKMENDCISPMLHKERRGLSEIIVFLPEGGVYFKVTIYSMNHFAGCKIIFNGGLAGCEGAIDMGL